MRTASSIDMMPVDARGCFSTVTFVGKHAVKRPSVDNARAVYALCNELSVLKCLGAHEHIVEVDEAASSDARHSPRLVMRRYSTTLSDEAVRRCGQRGRVRTCVRAARDVARALGHVHACGFVHGDVKADNVLLAIDGGDDDDCESARAVLADFGCAVFDHTSFDDVPTTANVYTYYAHTRRALADAATDAAAAPLLFSCELDVCALVHMLRELLGDDASLDNATDVRERRDLARARTLLDYYWRGACALGSADKLAMQLDALLEHDMADDDDDDDNDDINNNNDDDDDERSAVLFGDDASQSKIDAGYVDRLCYASGVDADTDDDDDDTDTDADDTDADDDKVRCLVIDGGAHVVERVERRAATTVSSDEQRERS